jgi:putative ABC transport system substrate-binding protein
VLRRGAATSLRRSLLRALAFGPLVGAFAADAQIPGRVWKLGMLLPSTRPPGLPDPVFAATLIPAQLGELGFVEGTNLVVDRRYAEAQLDRLPALARELVEARADAIVALGATATRAASQATTSIPILFYGNFDPVATGTVTNLARPGGNVTGVLIAPEGTLAEKKVELLLEVAPKARRIVFLAPPDPAIRHQFDEARQAASRQGVDVMAVEVTGGDYDRAFSAIERERPQALFVAAHTIFVRDRPQVIERANRFRVPAIYEWREHVVEGGLMSYGSSLKATSRRVAEVVGRIFKGTPPGDIPIEQPTTFGLVVNAGTARMTGIELPRTLLMRADEVIP